MGAIILFFFVSLFFVREREAAMLSVYNQSYLALSIGEEVKNFEKKI